MKKVLFPGVWALAMLQLGCLQVYRPKDSAQSLSNAVESLSPLEDPHERATSCSPAGCTGLQILTNRSEGVAPLAVQFRQSGPIHHRFRWTIAGRSLDGHLASHIFEEPGEYPVQLFRTVQNVTELVAVTTIRVLPFTGETYYIDCESGNDASNGLSPSEAWRNARKVQDHLSSRNPVETGIAPLRYNLRYLFKRGSTCELPKQEGSAQWLHLGGTHLLRFGAYGDPSLALPVLKESSLRNRQDPWSNLVYHHWNVKDVVFADLEWIGNYDERFPDGDTRYPTVAINPHDSKDIVLSRMKIRRFWGGLWVQSNSRSIFVDRSEIHTMGNVHIFGSSDGMSVTHSLIQKSNSGHNVYYGGRNLLFANNTILDSGFSRPQNWMQCGLRIESLWSDGPYSENVLLQGNTIGGSTGFSICLTRNDYQSGLGPQNVIIERNRLQGLSQRIQELQSLNLPGLDLTYGGGMITWAAGNVTFRNNLVLNPRGPAIQLNATAGGGSNWIRVLNNTIYKVVGAPSRQFDLDGSVSSYGYRIRNNLVFAPIDVAYHSSERPISEIPATILSNNLFYDPINALVPGRDFVVVRRGIEYFRDSLQTWRNQGLESNSMYQLDPYFRGLGTSPLDFLRLSSGSPANSSGVFLGSAPDSILGTLRNAPETSIGAFESGE